MFDLILILFAINYLISIVDNYLTLVDI